jgi:hypothetical protein
MLTLRLCIGEIAEALGLFGVAYIYLQIQSDPGIVAPLQVKAVLIATYLMIASASQAVIASRLRAMGLPVLFLNAVAVVVLFFLNWVGAASMRVVTTLAILTVLFRLLVGAISLRVPTQILYRFVSVSVGSPLLLAGFGGGYSFAITVYENYIFFPRTKEGFIMPTRWQDFVFLLMAAGVSIALVFISYRLLRYALRPKRATNAVIGN